MLETFFAEHGSILFKLIMAIFLGGLIGVERTLAGKMAGLRTYSIVSLGSCLLILTATLAMEQFPNTTVNPLYVMAAIATGIGFLCGGVIIYHENKLEGLTTAAGMWVASGIGIAVGFGYHILAAFAAIFTIALFSSFTWEVEQKFKEAERDR